MVYPDDDTSRNFQALRVAILTVIAAVTYDPITAITSPPHADYMLRQLIKATAGQPQRIPTRQELDCSQSCNVHWLIDLFHATHPQVYVAEQMLDGFIKARFEAVEAHSLSEMPQLNWRQTLTG